MVRIYIIHQVGVFTCPAEKPLTLHHSWVLTNPAAPSTSEMTLRYLSLFSLWLGISSLWHGQWWGIIRLYCCCLFSTIVYSLSLNISDQVRAGTAPARGRGTAQYTLPEGGGLPAALCRRVTDTSWHSPLLWLVVLSRERWILANQITATGGSHRQWIFTQLTCILFYRQVIMKMLANTTQKKKKIVTDYIFKT